MPAEPFERLDVSSWEVDRYETSGDEAKMWLREPSTDRLWLFKSVDIDPGGEDWAEKAAAELAQLLGVPCAAVEMAQFEGRRGSISADLRPSIYEMQPGTLYMQAVGVPGYIPGRVPGRPGHSLENLRNVLDGAQPPPASDLPFAATAFDVFAGYVVLDSLIANRDRHDENWSVLLPIAADGPTRLCGSYHHANSLGYNLSDEQRQMRLASSDGVRNWCRKGTAHRFEYTPGTSPQTLVHSWFGDRDRCAEAGIPADLKFATRPQQVAAMIERAMDAGVPFAWFTADEEFGQNPGLRAFLEERKISYVMAIPKNTELTGPETHKNTIEKAARQVRQHDWQRRSCGIGSKGFRVYEWALLNAGQPAHQYMIRRSIDDGELAYYHCYNPRGERPGELVRAAGMRWPIEESFEAAKGEAGLDNYQVRLYHAWYRHITLAMLALAFLAVMRHKSKKGTHHLWTTRTT